MIKTALQLLYKYAPVLWEMYRKYKEYEHERNVKKIKEDPAKSWDDRFNN